MHPPDQVEVLHGESCAAGSVATRHERYPVAGLPRQPRTLGHSRVYLALRLDATSPNIGEWCQQVRDNALHHHKRVPDGRQAMQGVFEPLSAVRQAPIEVRERLPLDCDDAFQSNHRVVARLQRRLAPFDTPPFIRELFPCVHRYNVWPLRQP